MTTTQAVAHVREVVGRHKPTIATMPGGDYLARRLEEHHWREEPLAPAPPGSGLRAVRGDHGLPGVGHTFEVLHGGVDYMLRRYERYGPVSWGSAFGRRIVTAIGPEATGQLLTDRGRDFSQNGWRYLIGPFFHRGLMLLDFDEHMFHRRIMQAAFTRDRLEGYLGVADRVVRREVAGFAGREGLRLFPALKALTLAVAAEVFMDAGHLEHLDELNAAFIATVRAGTALVRTPVPGGRWAAGLRGRKVLERHFRAELPAKRRADSPDLFAALCHATSEDGHRFSDDDVVNHMVFLMMAAHDTATITTTATAYHLAKHPRWQDAVRAELPAGGGPLTCAAVEGLETLDRVVNESLRLVAPVPVMVRESVRDTALAGHHVPAGTVVFSAGWVNHMLPDQWTDPHRFDPDRFSPGRREDKRHPFLFIPFGGGAHRCIGMRFGMLEVKTILHHLLANYRLELAPGYQVRWDTSSLPFPTDGLPIRLVPLRGRG